MTPETETEVQSPVGATLDWKAYFEGFSKLHGSNPIVIGDKLVFGDGWSYARALYQGPEFPPPADPAEHVALMLKYWTKRREYCAAQRAALDEMLQGLKAIQSRKTAPLMHRMTIRDESTGKAEVRELTVNIDDWQPRLSWLEADVQECDKIILSLRDKHERP